MIQVNTKIIGICITIILVVSIYICLSSPFYSVREYPRLQPILDNYTVIHNEAPPLDPDAIPETDIRYGGEWTNPKNKKLLLSLEKDVRWVRGWTPGWYNFPLIYLGKSNESARERMPRTMKLLEAIPSIRVAGLAVLMPRTTLGWHTDVTGKSSQSMAVNIGLYSPDSTLYIQAENGITYSSAQRDGEAIVFDSNLNHKVENHSNKPRMILYIDISHPF